MMRFENHGNGSRVLDVGCQSGILSNVLSQTYDTVGIDIQKACLKSERINEHLDFVLGDIDAFPFKNESFDLIVCGSLLEHMLDLSSVLKKLKRLLKVNGFLIVGYPVETWFFRTLWHLVSPEEFKFIEQPRTPWINPYSGQVENYWKHPGTHKQNFRSIRKALNEQFVMVQRVKLPSTIFPDLLSYYECAILQKL
jgi:ubiquinone/menaquinone biosynthesis C-methylase UbiE